MKRVSNPHRPHIFAFSPIPFISFEHVTVELLSQLNFWLDRKSSIQFMISYLNHMVTRYPVVRFADFTEVQKDARNGLSRVD